MEVAYSQTGACLNGGSSTVRNSKFHDSLWTCLDVWSTGNLVENNEAYHCWHQAIGFKVIGENVARNNYVHDAWTGFNCENGALPTLENNTAKAAGTSPACGKNAGVTTEPGTCDSEGGTYHGVLVYPSVTEMPEMK